MNPNKKESGKLLNIFFCITLIEILTIFGDNKDKSKILFIFMVRVQINYIKRQTFLLTFPRMKKEETKEESDILATYPQQRRGSRAISFASSSWAGSSPYLWPPNSSGPCHFLHVAPDDKDGFDLDLVAFYLGSNPLVL
jgi:hypothetical protein